LIINFGKKKLGFALLCHRRPERSFTILGRESPLCSRCTGLTIGVLGFIVLALLSLQIPLSAGLALMVPMLIDGGSQLFNMRESNNALRFMTGLFFAFGLMSLLVNVK